MFRCSSGRCFWGCSVTGLLRWCIVISDNLTKRSCQIWRPRCFGCLSVIMGKPIQQTDTPLLSVDSLKNKVINAQIGILLNTRGNSLWVAHQCGACATTYQSILPISWAKFLSYHGDRHARLPYVVVPPSPFGQIWRAAAMVSSFT